MLTQLVSQPGRLLTPPGVAEELVDVVQPRAGAHTLVADVGESGQQVTQQFRLQLVTRGEIGVAAFAGEGVMPRAVPIKSRLPEPGPGGDNGGVALYARRPWVEHREVLRRQGRDPVGVGLQVIDQRDRGEAELAGQLPRVDDPRPVGRLAVTVDHRAGDAEAGVGERKWVFYH